MARSHVSCRLTHTELFYTERNHLRNLKIMHRVYYMKMLSEPSWISKDLVRLLFPNLEEMIMLHGTCLCACACCVRHKHPANPAVVLFSRRLWTVLLFFTYM